MDMHVPSIVNSYLPRPVRAGFKGQNVGTAERVLSGVLGAWMLQRAWKRSGALGKTAMMIPAAAALKRAATGRCEIYQSMGLSSKHDESSLSTSDSDQIGKMSEGNRSPALQPTGTELH